jgi:hypothetical protein
VCVASIPSHRAQQTDQPVDEAPVLAKNGTAAPGANGEIRVVNFLPLIVAAESMLVWHLESSSCVPTCCSLCYRKRLTTTGGWGRSLTAASNTVIRENPDKPVGTVPADAKKAA